MDHLEAAMEDNTHTGEQLEVETNIVHVIILLIITHLQLL